MKSAFRLVLERWWQGHSADGAVQIPGLVVEMAWSLDSQLLALVVSPNSQAGCDYAQQWKVQVGSMTCS